MTFPTQVNVVQALAVAGDFADSNPRATVDAGPGALVAGTGGVTVGRFAWADSTMTTVLNTGTGAPTGFVGRRNQALIVAFLAEGSNVIQQGHPVTLFNVGGFFVTNNNVSAASVVGQKAFANLATGAVRFAAAGTALSGDLASHAETKFYAQSIGAITELVKITTHALG